MKFNDYQAGRDTVLRGIHSSFRHRPEGFDGILSDLKVAEDHLSRPVPPGVDRSDWLLGIRSVIQDCHTAIRTY